MFGGKNGPLYFNDVYVLNVTNPTLFIWTFYSTNGAPPTGRSLSALTSFGDRLLVMGGMTSIPIDQGIYCLDLLTFQWKEEYEQSGIVYTSDSSVFDSEQ